MLDIARLTEAIDIQVRSYKLLKWLADAVAKGFISAPRAHQYTDLSETAHDWMETHFASLPLDARPERSRLRTFAQFFSTYLTTSFDVIDNPGTRLATSCGCYCPLCSRIAQAPYLQTKKLTAKDKTRAKHLMEDRLIALALEEGRTLTLEAATGLVTDEVTRRAVGYSAYGHWQIRRMGGYSDGTAILALWREIAWLRTGSPRKGFKLRAEDFVAAEELLVRAISDAG